MNSNVVQNIAVVNSCVEKRKDNLNSRVDNIMES